jgi:hypothetical protein
VSRQSSRLSSSSSHDGQAEGTSQQSRQSHPPPSLARSGPRTRGGHAQPQPTPRQRRAAAEELTQRESSKLTTPSSPEVHEQRLSESISVPPSLARAEDSAVEECARGPVVPAWERGL